MQATHATRWFRVVAAVSAVLCAGAGAASAGEAFVFSGQPIHPGCVHAIAMRSGDRIPVTRSVSLEGCMASDRVRADAERDPLTRDLLYIEDEALIGEGGFGYRVLAVLENGVFIVGIRRTDGGGIVRASLAAMDLVERPELRDGQVMQRKVLESIGEVWLASLETMTLRTSGNVVQYVDGLGRERVERTIDLSRIARARRR